MKEYKEKYVDNDIPGFNVYILKALRIYSNVIYSLNTLSFKIKIYIILTGLN